jgi:alpha-glucoside transport system permease protein
MHPAILGLVTIILGVGGCVSYFYFSNLFVDKVLYPSTGKHAGRNINRANIIRPWLFLAPAVIALGTYLAYPVFATLWYSVTERVPGGGNEFVGLANYKQMLAEPKFWEALKNNAMWLVIVPAMSTVFGLLVAQLTDRIKWGNIAKSLIFMPMAISFVGAAVIWKLVYDTRPVDQEQIGVLNALYLWFGGTEPQTWLTMPIWNSIFLMIVLIWIQTGFAMVILSAALRGIPEETIEAAIVDGANPFQVFLRSRCRRSPAPSSWSGLPSPSSC